jgi:hypothetical protein
VRAAHLTPAAIITFITLCASSNAQTVVTSESTETPIATSARTQAAAFELRHVDSARETTTRPAAAQEPGAERTRLQLGVALRGTVTPGIDTSDGLDPTFVWRWRGKGSRIDDRWAPTYRLGSYSSHVSAQLGAREMPVGEIKVKPLMIGLDYKMPRGKWNWAAGMAVGWAMNSIDLPWEDRARATDAVGASDLWADVHNSLVWGPRLKGWYDVDRRLSYIVEAGYLVHRPEIDVRANGRLSTRRLNADAFVIKAGVVYGIF